MKKHPQRRHGKKPASGPSLLERINVNAAGIECGADVQYVAVPAERDSAARRRGWRACSAKQSGMVHD